MEEWLSQEKFEMVKSELEKMIKAGWEISKMIACIYELFQEYIISETQEQILYNIADPFEDFNECSKYYKEMDYDNPLMSILK